MNSEEQGQDEGCKWITNAFQLPCRLGRVIELEITKGGDYKTIGNEFIIFE